ncbi:TPA: hypothetical protein ACTYX2_001684 [Klebsiella pneumoniae]|nr:hypothetical protein [Klebsiella variicola subsp. variicola]
MDNSIVTNRKGKGIFKREEWIKESKSLYLSAKLLRQQGGESRSKISSSKERDRSVSDLIDIVVATDKSSRLLLGYAFELLLKSAILLMNYGATKNTIYKIFKSYSHDLQAMVIDLGLTLSNYELELLKLLSQDIVQQARYPIGNVDDDEYLRIVNERSHNLANKKLFNDMICLYEKIKSIVVVFDRDVNKCADLNVFRGSYFTLFMRRGGGLRSRAIVCFTELVSTANKNKKYIKKTIESECKGLSVFYTYYWDTFDFYEDTGKCLRELPEQ